jgi:HK97 family phage major capsid protein
MISPVSAASDRRAFDLGLTEREAERYSVSAAILGTLSKENSFEKEVSRTMQGKLGRPPRGPLGLFIPTRLKAAGLDRKTNVGGGYLTQTSIVELIDALRLQMRLSALGATWLTGLSYSAQFVVENGTTGASWLAENSGIDVGQQDMAFGAITATPKTLQATVAISRQLLAQASSNVQIEQRIRMDLMRSHAVAFEAAAIAGPGSANQPLGILNVAGINTVSCGANGAAATYANLVDLEKSAGNANADAPNVAFLTNPGQRAALRKVFVNGAGSESLWRCDEGQDQCIGRPAAVSTGVPASLTKGSGSNLSAIIAGKFDELLLCEFGAIEILSDEYRLKKQAMCELTSFSMVDCLLPRPAAIAVIADAV